MKILLSILFAVALCVAGRAAQTETVPFGKMVTFSVTFSGPGPYAYQWKKNGGDIPGATAATYVIPSFTASHEGAYSVVVQNPAGAVRSDDGVVLAIKPTTKGVVTFVVSDPVPVPAPAPAPTNP